jgi:hypothetical protein
MNVVDGRPPVASCGMLRPGRYSGAAGNDPVIRIPKIQKPQLAGIRGCVRLLIGLVIYSRQYLTR